MTKDRFDTIGISSISCGLHIYRVGKSSPARKSFYKYSNLLNLLNPPGFPAKPGLEVLDITTQKFRIIMPDQRDANFGRQCMPPIFLLIKLAHKKTIFWTKIVKNDDGHYIVYICVH